VCEEERERRKSVEGERDMLMFERDELELKCKAKDRKIAALQEKLAVAQATADVVVLGDSDSSGDDEVAQAAGAAGVAGAAGTSLRWRISP
jgi:hypothetical protein